MSHLHLKQYVPEIKLFVEGKERGDLRESLVDLIIDEELQSPAKFALTLADELNIDSQKLKWLDNPIIQPGKKITMALGYVPEISEFISEGIIKTISTSGFSQSGSPRITITGYDQTHRWLSKSPERDDNTTSLELTGSDIVKLISQKTGFKNQIEKVTEYPTQITTRNNTTYGTILRDRARSIGFECFTSHRKKIEQKKGSTNVGVTNRGTFFFVNPRPKNAKPSLEFEWGKDLIQFIPRLNTSNLVESVEVNSMPNNSKEPIKGIAKMGEEDKLEDKKGISTASEFLSKLEEEPRVKELNDNNLNSQEEAVTRARAELNILGDSLITGNGSIVGNTDLQVGQIIKINKVGNLFNGNYFVTKVTNEISSGGYITRFSVRRNVIRIE